jgi:two-component system, cell cycle response regulator DivK
MKPFNILVIDDSTTNIVLIDAVLSDKGYQIDTALTADEAFMRIERQVPDLILLDLLMPKVSGFDFLEKLRQDPKTLETPVIVVSALTDDDNIQKIKKFGTVDFLKKPIDIQYLVDLVKDIVQKTYIK